MKKASQDYKDAIMARDFAKATFEDAQAAGKVTNKKPIQKVKSKEEKIKDENHKLVSNIKNMVTTGKMQKLLLILMDLMRGLLFLKMFKQKSINLFGNLHL